MKKKIRLMIIVSVVIAIIIGIILIILLKEQNNQLEENSITNIEEIEELAQRQEKLHVETNRNRFYIIKNCINKFYNSYQCLNVSNLDIKLMDEELDIEATIKQHEKEIYAMLDKEYINYKGITLDNVSNVLGKIGKATVAVDKIYTKDLENSEYICFVEGRIIEKNSNVKEFNMIVRLSKTDTFKILLEDYMVDNNYINISEDIDTTKLCSTEITDETYNKYTNTAIDSNTYINDLFNSYKNDVIYDQQSAYEAIDEEYRKIRFNNISEFLTYKNENYKEILTASLDTYSQSTRNGTTQYICKDNYGKYYIFNETAPFQYKIILDTYTFPTEDFIQQYNKSLESEKVVLDIQRFFMGINDKNYGYSYSVLSSSFKNNNYPTREAFVNFATQNFFAENEVHYIQYEKQNDLYIYKIKLTDPTGVSTQEKNFNIIIRIGSGTDYEMSFGVAD